MASQIGSMNNVKIFVLYLMKNINYPMDYVTINEIVMQTDYVLYLDFAEAFHQMLEGGLIAEDGRDERGDPLYSVTHKGRLVAEQLKSDILPTVLDKSMACALQYLDFRRRGIVADCESERLPDQTYNVTVTLKEKDKVILSIRVNADSEYRAQQIKKSFRDRPNVIYRGILALFSGRLDFLYDSKYDNKSN
jgi:hypothetical protein